MAEKYWDTNWLVTCLVDRDVVNLYMDYSNGTSFNDEVTTAPLNRMDRQ